MPSEFPCLLGDSPVASAGFEPTKAEPSDLQSDPFGHLGNLPGRPRPNVVIQAKAHR